MCVYSLCIHVYKHVHVCVFVSSCPHVYECVHDCDCLCVCFYPCVFLCVIKPKCCVSLGSVFFFFFIFFFFFSFWFRLPGFWRNTSRAAAALAPSASCPVTTAAVAARRLCVSAPSRRTRRAPCRTTWSTCCSCSWRRRRAEVGAGKVGFAAA